MPTYIRLTDYKSSYEKERGFFKPENRYEAKQEDFEKIPGSPIAYWVSDRVQTIFQDFKKIADIGQTREGLTTGDNDKFMRLWYEVPIHNVGLGLKRNEAQESKKKWFPYNKGGEYSKWYSNAEYIVNWENDGAVLQTRLHPSGRVWAHNFNLDYIFKPHISWTAISNKGLGFRYFPQGFLFDANGLGLFPSEKTNFYLILGLLNTKNAEFLVQMVNSSMKFNAGDISKIPIILPIHENTKSKINRIVKQNIDISKEEWDSRETSWDFRTNELVRMKNEALKVKSCRVEDAYNAYCDYWREKFFQLHANEEELNRLFIDIYELQDELTPDVPLEDITILKNEAKIVDGELVFQADEIMKQLISYGVGVMFGRYALDKEGLQVANLGDETLVSLMTDETKVSFPIDDDNIIPVLEDDYFKDDIASRFVQFIKTAFGEEHLSENIQFIEEALGTPLRKYFVKGFYDDHIRRYKKRPIYWMVASSKKSFMALMYMHRYQPDVFARVQNNYLREYMTKLEAALTTQQQVVNDENNSTKVRKDAQKQIDAINKKMDEIIKFDRDRLTSFAQGKVEIDLDDGVKVNYCRFKEILYPITGLCK